MKNLLTSLHLPRRIFSAKMSDVRIAEHSWMLLLVFFTLLNGLILLLSGYYFIALFAEPGGVSDTPVRIPTLSREQLRETLEYYRAQEALFEDIERALVDPSL